jgi:large subunit ribosomal protein L18
MKKNLNRHRLSVRKTNTGIYAQITNDLKGTIITSISSKVILETKKNCTVEIAKKVGQELGKRALERGISLIYFDRGEYRYHGQVKALAEGARESGLLF